MSLLLTSLPYYRSYQIGPSWWHWDGLDHPGSPPHRKVLNLHLQSLLPWRATYTQILGIRTGTSSGGITLPPGTSQHSNGFQENLSLPTALILSVTWLKGSRPAAFSLYNNVQWVPCTAGMSDVQEKQRLKWIEASLGKCLPILWHVYERNLLDIFLDLTQPQEFKSYPTEFQHLGSFCELKRYSHQSQLSPHVAKRLLRTWIHESERFAFHPFLRWQQLRKPEMQHNWLQTFPFCQHQLGIHHV